MLCIPTKIAPELTLCSDYSIYNTQTKLPLKTPSLRDLLFFPATLFQKGVKTAVMATTMQFP